MQLKLKTAASSYPVTISEMRSQSNIDPNLADSEVTELIADATNFLERACNRSFVAQTWVVTLPGFPQNVGWFPYYAMPYNQVYNYYMHLHPNRIVIDLPPTTAINSVQYYDSNNSLQTLVSGTDFAFINSTNQAAWIEPINGDWPTTFCRGDAVKIEFVAGSPPGTGDSSSTLPPTAKRAIRLIGSNWNVFREAEVMGTTSPLGFGVDRIIDQLRIWLKSRNKKRCINLPQVKDGITSRTFIVFCGGRNVHVRLSIK